jgi:hypothetical protein
MIAESTWGKMAQKWEDEGKDPMLFWAGRLSIAAGFVIKSRAEHLSSNISFLADVKRKYDSIVSQRTK